jgi:hypothetical protein
MKAGVVRWHDPGPLIGKTAPLPSRDDADRARLPQILRALAAESVSPMMRAA